MSFLVENKFQDMHFLVHGLIPGIRDQDLSITKTMLASLGSSEENDAIFCAAYNHCSTSVLNPFKNVVMFTFVFCGIFWRNMVHYFSKLCCVNSHVAINSSL